MRWVPGRSVSNRRHLRDECLPAGEQACVRRRSNSGTAWKRAGLLPCYPRSPGLLDQPWQPWAGLVRREPASGAGGQLLTEVHLHVSTRGLPSAGQAPSPRSAPPTAHLHRKPPWPRLSSSSLRGSWSRSVAARPSAAAFLALRRLEAPSRRRGERSAVRADAAPHRLALPRASGRRHLQAQLQELRAEPRLQRRGLPHQHNEAWLLSLSEAIRHCLVVCSRPKHPRISTPLHSCCV